MNGILLAIMAFSSPLAESKDAKEFLQNMVSPQEDRDCPHCRDSSVQKERNLKIFISFAVPEATWKDDSAQLEKTDGIFVVRGLPGDSFALFAQKVKALRDIGVLAPIEIDPPAFAKEQIDRVPAIVLKEGSETDKIAGNIRLDAALKMFAEQGSARNAAAEHLKRLEMGDR